MIGKPLTAERWNELLKTDKGEEIVKALAPFHERAIRILPLNPELIATIEKKLLHSHPTYIFLNLGDQNRNTLLDFTSIEKIFKTTGQKQRLKMATEGIAISGLFRFYIMWDIPMYRVVLLKKSGGDDQIPLGHILLSLLATLVVAIACGNKNQKDLEKILRTYQEGNPLVGRTPNCSIFLFDNSTNPEEVQMNPEPTPRQEECPFTEMKREINDFLNSIRNSETQMEENGCSSGVLPTIAEIRSGLENIFDKYQNRLS